MPAGGKGGRGHLERERNQVPPTQLVVVRWKWYGWATLVIRRLPNIPMKTSRIYLRWWFVEHVVTLSPLWDTVWHLDNMTLGGVTTAICYISRLMTKMKNVWTYEDDALSCPNRQYHQNSYGEKKIDQHFTRSPPKKKGYIRRRRVDSGRNICFRDIINPIPLFSCFILSSAKAVVAVLTFTKNYI